MNVANIQRVLIVGGGASGQQIAAQFARFGYQVVMYDIDQGRLDDCRRRQRGMLNDLAGQAILRRAEVDETLARIYYTAEAATAAADADLLSECVPEDLELKRGVFRQFHPLCKPSTIFTTNASYLLPSSLAFASGRPERFAAFHFHVPVWYANAVDVMPHRRTSPEVIETLCALAGRIGQVPILARRENPGYVFNTLLQPLLLSAIDLAAREVAEFREVDRAWMAVTKMPLGPFGILDQIGLDTVHLIVQQSGKWLSESQKRRAANLLEPYLKDERRGEKSGRGFYEYPAPAYLEPGFLPGQAVPTSEKAPAKQRLVPVSVPSPVHVQHELRPAGRVMLWGADRTAEALQQRFQQAGADVCRVPQELSAQQIASWHATQWQAGPLPHLCLVAGPSDERPDLAAAGREYPLEFPFLLTQAWFGRLRDEGLQDQASLLAVCRMGGSFGIANPIERPEDGALAALVKSVALESMTLGGPGIRGKVVDLSARCPADRGAERVLRELALAQAAVVTGDRTECRRRHADIEVGYVDEQRHVIRYRPEPLPAIHDARPPHGVWLVSGGAGGITLQVALALARRYQLELHVLGRTPLPQEDYLQWSPEDVQALKSEVMKTAYRQKQKPNVAWEPYEKGIRLQQSLDVLRRADIAVRYHACDISDCQAVTQVVALLGSEGRTITGVLHGAGVEHTARFELKTRELFHQTLAPKGDGTRALFEATRQAPLEWFIAFGSLAGRFGGIGQVDYAMANQLLAQIVRRLAAVRPECRCVAMDWAGWDTVGMAARPESRFLLERAAHHLMPIEEGIEHFLREVESGGLSREVVIADPWELGPEFLAPQGRKDRV